MGQRFELHPRITWEVEQAGWCRLRQADDRLTPSRRMILGRDTRRATSYHPPEADARSVAGGQPAGSPGGDPYIDYAVCSRGPTASPSVHDRKDRHIRRDDAGRWCWVKLFYGPGLGAQLSRFVDLEGRSHLRLRVSDPESLGVVELTSPQGDCSLAEKKRLETRSNPAIRVCYYTTTRGGHRS